MTEDLTPTTLRRQLGARLRALRQERNETARQLGDALGFSVSKVSRMESGARAVSEQDLSSLVDHFKLGDVEASDLARTARGGRRRREPFVSVDPEEGDFQRFVQSGFVEFERDAAKVREFNEGVIPGLLQTTSYMRAMMLSASPGDIELVEKAIALRLARQRRLERRGQYSVIIDEAALLREVGGPGVMSEQLRKIIQQAESGSAEVRVIPLSRGYHPGVNSSFVMLSIEVGRLSDLVFVEGLLGFQKIDRAEEVDRFERIWGQLGEVAESSSCSLDLLAHRSDEYASAARASPEGGLRRGAVKADRG